MTRDERIKAFSLRVDGLKWSEISKELGYNPSTIREDLEACLCSTPRQPSVVYPEIKDFIIRVYGGVIKSFAMDLHCGSYGSVYPMLSGRNRPTPEFRAAVSSLMGQDPDTIFRKGEDT